ncbi:MAG TPA: O-antigen ligase family protein [Gammaproteobacteria bacterium]
MSPALASLLTTVFIAGLFIRESRKDDSPSPALWIPVAWLVITGSRFVSQWLALGQPQEFNVTDGSPIDAAFFLACMVMSVAVLVRRGVKVADVVRWNGWMVAFLAFGLISVLWSDFPFIAFKRWIKVLGHPLVALVILTDPNPKKALVVVMKRCAFLLLPVSVLFIKYYPEYGRGFDPWTGEAFNKGVGINKNYLGYLSMVFGLFFFWYLLIARKLEDNWERRSEILLSAGLIGMALWLLHMADSATSLATLVIGVGIVLAMGSRLVNKRFVGTYVVVTVLACILIEATFDVYDTVIQLLNRDPTLTDRTKVWADVIALQPNVLLGTGFESFWLGSRLEVLWAKWWWQPNQAHNGYIETYLNLGLIGVFLLGGLLISTFRNICSQFLEDSDMARLRLAFLVVIVFYNYTEAAFKGVHFIWTIFHLIAVNYPHSALLEGERKRAGRRIAGQLTTIRRAAVHGGRAHVSRWVNPPRGEWRKRLRSTTSRTQTPPH